jgi:cellobiose phosphorylase
LQGLLTLAFLPYHAWLTASAIAVTLFRLGVTKKNMLEWVTSADAERVRKNTPGSYARLMMGGLFQVPVLLLLAILSGQALMMSPLLALWICSPLIASFISEDKPTAPEIDAETRTELRVIARKTWRYFEELAGKQNHYLAPDNYQVDPPRGVAAKTSPTNIGLGLLATLTARDMGYIGTTELLDLTEKTVSTIESLPKWNGHLYNWYNTQTLKAMHPMYVSTVDSGNLAGSLLALEQGLREYQKQPVWDRRFFGGFQDTLRCAQKSEEEISAQIAAAFGDVDTAKEMNALIFKRGLILLEKNMGEPSIENSTWEKKARRMLRLQIEEAERIVAEYTGAEQSTAQACHRFETLIKRVRALFENMRFAPLYNLKKKLFSIGYNLEEDKLTNAHYDLLASEARLASYISIASGELPPEHWFRMGRSLTTVDRYKGLISWTGTMFEYLMPLLFLKSYPHTLLDETYSFVMKSQIKYGKMRNMPWGVSESAFNALDRKQDYQYKAIGVPWLGLKRRLTADAVTTPYATFLALLVNPAEAVKNINRLKNEGLEGPYGFYEAADYTPDRLYFELSRTVIKSFMAHHQGMSLLAIGSYLNGGSTQKRFHANPAIHAYRLLLQEKVPAEIIITKSLKKKVEPVQLTFSKEYPPIRKTNHPNFILPKVHILSNGNNSVMLTDAGTGYSKNKVVALTRWRTDSVSPPYGMFFYLRDTETDFTWSAAYAPLNRMPDKYEVVFEGDKATFTRTDGVMETKMEVFVASGDNVEIRKISLRNSGNKPKLIDITSYFETVLTAQETDAAHPAFSNLFVETGYHAGRKCLTAKRRPRSEGEKELWIGHFAVDSGNLENTQFETDRMRFLGRGHTVKNPDGLMRGKPLSSTTGAVLDPIMSLRVSLSVTPGKTSTLSFVTISAESRELLFALRDRYLCAEDIETAALLAFARSKIETKYRSFPSSEIALYQEALSHILFLSPLRRKRAAVLSQNRQGQSALWKYGISGDTAILLVILRAENQIELMHAAIRMQEYWGLMDVSADLVIISDEEYGYQTPLYTLIRDTVEAKRRYTVMHSPDDLFILNRKEMPEEDVSLLISAARIVLEGGNGDIKEQLPQPELPVPKKRRAFSPPAEYAPPAMQAGEELLYFNGLGGFSPDGREYRMRIRPDQNTPMPWINVIANPQFGFTVSESGSGYTFFGNSHEYRLTPWSNDAISDTPGEVFYLCDLDTGQICCPTPLPVTEKTDYSVRHGFGYSVFESTANGIGQSLTQYVPIKDPVKISLLRLTNQTGRARRLAVTYYIRPVLGVSEKATAMHIKTGLDQSGAFVIENPYNEDFPGRVCFMEGSEKEKCFTGDSKEFFGTGDISAPESLLHERLSGAVGTGFDPCGVIQMEILLKPNEGKELVFLLGAVENTDEIAKMAARYNTPDKAAQALWAVKTFWEETLGVIQADTPNVSMNLMLNGWLPYQVISCRMWARTGFYQSSGAFGFRDQLQDALSIATVMPELTRAQILLHAGHQFAEGDVQHWWHEPSGKGVRTRFSDDLLWLPYVTAAYVKTTGDTGILQTEIPFLQGAALAEQEDERYGNPGSSNVSAALYEHCLRAIEQALRFGEHGLPLMGGGDWNDGMNTVGNKGRGESVWLGWFLASVLDRFAPVCEAMGDCQTAKRYEYIQAEMLRAIEHSAWDGCWYKRAYFDDGTPLGSARNTDCKIDSIAQSWAVLSGLGDSIRAQQAMNALEDYLISREDGVIRLLTPSFDKGDSEPGYIKGYVPGIRENGGQYTHAAAWAIIAFAKLGDGDKAVELYDLINPIHHTNSYREYSQYKAEPYVMAADVYAGYPHTGRGGWSWYTGAAGWMYQAGLEHILGLKKTGDTLTMAPCIPEKWNEYSVRYRFKETMYLIRVRNPAAVQSGVLQISLDGIALADPKIPLVNDQAWHHVDILMGN